MDKTQDVWAADNELNSWELLDNSSSDDEDFEIIQQLFNETQATDSSKKNSLVNLADSVFFQNESNTEQIPKVPRRKLKNGNDKDKVEKLRKRNHLKPRKNILKPVKNISKECLEQLERQDIQETIEKAITSKLKMQNEEKKKKLKGRLGGISLATILTAFGLSLIYLKPALDIRDAHAKPVLNNSNTDITENTSYSFDEEKLYHEYKPKTKIIKDHDRKIKQFIRGFDVKPIKNESKRTSCKSFGPKTYEEFMKEFTKKNSYHKDDICQNSDANKLIPNSTKSKLQSKSVAETKTKDIITSVNKYRTLSTNLNVRTTDSNHITRGATNSGLQKTCYTPNENVQHMPKNETVSEVFQFTSNPNNNSIIKSDDHAPCDTSSKYCLLIDEQLKECIKNDRKLKKLNRKKYSLPKPNSKADVEDLLHFVRTYKKITKLIDNFSHEQSRVLQKLEKAVFRKKFCSKVQQLAAKKLKEYEDKKREQMIKENKNEINVLEFQNSALKERTEFMKTEGEKAMKDILRVTIQSRLKNNTKTIEEFAVKQVEQILSKDEHEPLTENINLSSNNNTQNNTSFHTKALLTQEETACLENEVKVNKNDYWKRAVKNVKDDEQRRFMYLPDKSNPQKTWIKKKLEF